MTRETSKKGQADTVERLEHLEHLCRERELRMTPQRRAVLETLIDSSDHPSAEQLFARVEGKLPGLSRATVFRILEQLVAKGIIAKASHPGRSARYDVRTELHHHMICLRCEAMIDIFEESLNRLTLPDTTAYSFETVDFHVQLRGYCKSCKPHTKGSRSPDRISP